MSKTKTELATTSGLEWKALEESIVKLAATVWRSDYDDDEEEREEKRQGNECRPKNAEIMLKLLPVLKEKCGDRVPSTYTLCDGTVALAWTNPQTRSQVTYSIRVDEKGREIDVSKYPIPGKLAFRFFPLPIADVKEEESIGAVLVEFLRDISL